LKTILANCRKYEEEKIWKFLSKFTVSKKSFSLPKIKISPKKKPPFLNVISPFYRGAYLVVCDHVPKELEWENMGLRGYSGWDVG